MHADQIIAIIGLVAAAISVVYIFVEAYRPPRKGRK